MVKELIPIPLVVVAFVLAGLVGVAFVVIATLIYAWFHGVRE